MKRKIIKKYFIVLTLLIQSTFFAGCSLSIGKSNTSESQSKIFRKEISYGMTQAEIASALGAPKLVSKDGGNQETWVYEHYAANVSYSTVSERSSNGNREVSKKLILTGVNPEPNQAPKDNPNLLAIEVSFNDDKKVVGFNSYPSLH